MFILIICLIISNIVTFTTLSYFLLSIQKNKFATINKQEKIEVLEKENITLHEQLTYLTNRVEELLIKNTSIGIELTTTNSQNHDLKLEINEYKQLCDSLKNNIFTLENNLTINKERMLQLEKSYQHLENAKEESIKSAKAAIFEVGQQLSNKLLEDHKRESEEHKKNNDEQITKTTSQLYEQFNKIIQSVSTLTTQVQESRESVDIVKKALLSPIGAGSLAEITLENILKSSGLIDGQDFIMQYSVNKDIDDQTKLRPDAIIFLPAGNCMIIDSKASKYFLEIASTNDEQEKAELLEKLKLTMRNHLKSLINKDYKTAIINHLTKLYPHNKINLVSSIIFLPSEIAIETLHNADKDFINKAWVNNIFPAGPISLINILSNIKFQIIEHQRTENHQLIIEEIKRLLGSVNIICDYAKKVGNSLQSAMSNYDKFAGSFNSNFLSKARRIEKLGIHNQQNKPLPLGLDRYQIVTTNNMEYNIEDQIDNHLAKQEEEEKSLLKMIKT